MVGHIGCKGKAKTDNDKNFSRKIFPTVGLLLLKSATFEEIFLEKFSQPRHTGVSQRRGSPFFRAKIVQK